MTNGGIGFTEDERDEKASSWGERQLKGQLSVSERPGGRPTKKTKAHSSFRLWDSGQGNLGGPLEIATP